MTKEQIKRIERRLNLLWEMWNYKIENINLKDTVKIQSINLIEAEKIQLRIHEINHMLSILGYQSELNDKLECKIIKSNV